MSALVTESLPLLAGAPNGIKKLRELILLLAVRGKLVPQDPLDEPAHKLHNQIAADRARLALNTKTKQKPRIEIAEVEKLFSLPAGWDWIRNSDLFGLKKGKVPKDLGDDVTKIPYLDIEALDRGNIRRYTEDRLCPQATDSDILVVCDGSRSGLVLKGKAGAVGSTLAVVETPPYVQSFVQLILKQSYERLNSTMKGAAIPHLDTASLAREVVGLPPLAEQTRIITKVEELMALCDRLEAQQADAEGAHAQLVEALLGNLTQAQDSDDFAARWQRLSAHFHTLFITEPSIETLKQTLLQLAVMGKLVPQDSKDEPVSELLNRIESVKLRLVNEDRLRTTARSDVPQDEQYLAVPSSWAYCRLGNLARFIDYRGRTPNKVSAGVPLITAKNVRCGFVSREPREFIAKENYTNWMTRGFPRLGDMLFTTEAPLGNIALVDISERFALAQRVICFQLHELGTGPFLRLAIMSGAVQAQFQDAATGMTATGIKASRLKEIPIPIPPLTEQHRIVAKVDQLMALCDQLKSRLIQIRHLNDQLASALVERAVA